MAVRFCAAIFCAATGRSARTFRLRVGRVGSGIQTLFCRHRTLRVRPRHPRRLVPLMNDVPVSA